VRFSRKRSCIHRMPPPMRSVTLCAKQTPAALRPLFQVAECSIIWFSKRRQASVGYPAVCAIHGLEVIVSRRHAKGNVVSRTTPTMDGQTGSAIDREGTPHMMRMSLASKWQGTPITQSRWYLWLSSKHQGSKACGRVGTNPAHTHHCK